MNLVELLAKTVETYGQKTSLQYVRSGEYQSISYNELWNLIQQFAQGLSEIGVKPDSKVAILSKNRPEWAVSDFAILSLKAVVVPIYPTLPSNQVEFILHNADIDFVIVEDESQLEKVLETSHRLQGIIMMDMFGEEVVSGPETLQSLVHVSNADGVPADSWTFSRIVEDGKTARFRESHLDDNDIDEERLATIVYTSGTSGNPKGVMLTHRNIVSNVSASLKVLPIHSEDIGLSYLPLSHVFERTVGHFAPLSIGATIAYAQGIDSIQRNLKQVRPTILVTVPRLLEKVYTGIQEQILTKPRWLRHVLQKPIRNNQSSGMTYRLVDRILYRKIRKGLGGRIRLVVSGGAGLAEEIGRFYSFAGVPVYEGYGMTESAPVITVNPYNRARFGTVGQPLPNVEVSLAEDGELVVRGPNVMRGYLNAPEETDKVLEPSGWLHTGDLAELSDGYIRIVDRKKNLLVLATGKNVAPWPIESALTLAPHIGTALVVGDGRKYVTVLLTPDFDAIKDFLEQHQIYGNPEEWVRHREVVSLFQAEATDAVKDFAEFEQPKRAILIPTDWTVDSGELTPTLKVKRKVVLNNYKHRIEAMYAGEDYIPLGTGAPKPIVAPSTEMPSEETSAKTPHSPRRRPVPWILRGVSALAVLSVVGLSSLLLTPPKGFNLNGMIHGIHRDNQKINQQNQKIVGTMKNIRQSSSATPVIAHHLITLNNGIYKNEDYLHQLDSLSQQEVTLSQQFKSLADSMKGNMQSISSSSSQEQKGLGSMNNAAQGVAADAGQLKSIQKSIQGKLAQAAQKSKTIANEMP